MTVRGKDAVVVVASDEFDRLRQPGQAPNLVRAMADPSIRSLDFEHPKLRPPVSDVNL